MSDSIKDGGFAFPCDSAKQFPTQEGMTLRDWFAGQALASMTVAPDYSKGPCNFAMAERAYCIADAMLEARNKEVAP